MDCFFCVKEKMLHKHTKKALPFVELIPVCHQCFCPQVLRPAAFDNIPSLFQERDAGRKKGKSKEGTYQGFAEAAAFVSSSTLKI